MDLKIRNVAEKGDWLARLSLLLRDALVLEQGTWDVRERRFELGLERVCYEYRDTETGPGVREYPGIACRLVVAPVSSFGKDMDEDDGDFGDADELMSVALDGSDVLRLATRRGLCRLILGPDAWLEIFDVAEASHRRITRDHGESPIESADLRRLVNARVI